LSIPHQNQYAVFITEPNSHVKKKMKGEGKYGTQRKSLADIPAYSQKNWAVEYSALTKR
jgi:hypothetical protein